MESGEWQNEVNGQASRLTLPRGLPKSGIAGGAAMWQVYISAGAWAGIWGAVYGIGLLLYQPKPYGDSGPWQLGIPLYLLSGMAIWGAVHGAVLFRKKGSIPGAVFGVLLGTICGALGDLVFLLLGSLLAISVPSAPQEWGPSVVIGLGMMAGAVAGGALAGTLREGHAVAASQSKAGSHLSAP
jgi:hypothetical protein